MELQITGNETARAMLATIIEGRLERFSFEQVMSEMFGLLELVKRETGSDYTYTDTAEGCWWNITEVHFN